MLEDKIERAREILEDEDITLLDDGADIIQKKQGFRFGADAVILAEFYRGKSRAKILEIGSGTGIIPILLCQRNAASDITALEIQREMAELTQRNLRRNSMEDRVRVLNMDVKELREGNTYDCVISNPPYMTIDGKKINPNDSRAVARHEISLNLRELVENAKRLLKPRGQFYMIHRSYRLSEILVELERNDFSPKRIRSVYSDRFSEAKLVLVEASKGRREKLTIEQPLYLDERE
ncbi:16S rRNA methyltransferase [Propionigenium maris DSM 9537]|uniref:16S rRNA methyltransferase n=1 Tax=Propionigenium maris DSM 9537 TaxID=1123000 RepID=A0A9W6GLS0_9FUSO|nr:methyltransferase [Propionigenium maris]GLI56174.1 16S rRNA methyltransferase [Propionigenium maris DSM 9537]